MNKDDIEGTVKEILRQRGIATEARPELLLGTGGLALDSIDMAELLLSCESRFGIVIAAELLAGEPLTFAGLVARVKSSLAS